MADDVNRILYVEDDRDSREMMKVMLHHSLPGVAVTAVGTAAEAIELAFRDRFDLYILDIWLPGMDGLDLCRRLRDRGVTSPIVFFSAMVRTDDKDYAIKAGADAYLVKPRDIEIFPQTIARLLNDKAAAESV